jgi:hypothetical protein
VVPYKVIDKKGKKAEVPEAREGLRHRARPKSRSGDTAAPSAQEGVGDEDEEVSAS